MADHWRNRRRDWTAEDTFIVVACLLPVPVVIGAVYVAVHFIIKFW